jgi:hypothetical protein
MLTPRPPTHRTRIVWLSQHTPTPRQLATLETIFPNYHLIIDARSFDGADTIVARFRSHGGDEMVLVAPMAVVREIVRRGIHPIYAEMRPTPCSSKSVEVRIKNRCYRFIRFHRVHGLHFDLEPLEAQPLTHKEDQCTQQ